MIFPVGTKVILRPDVLQRHARSVPNYMGYTTAQFQWRDILNKLGEKEGVITREFESNHRNVQFDGQLIGIDYTELLAISPEYTKKKFNGERHGLDGVGLTKSYAKFLCESQQIQIPKMGYIVDLWVDNKIQQLHNISGDFFLIP